MKLRTIYFRQALSIACAVFRDANTGELNEERAQLLNHTELSHSKYPDIFNNEGLRLPNQSDSAFVWFLRRKYAARIRQHIFGVVTWGLATLGMTLVAIDLFYRPVTSAGLFISLAAATGKLIEVFDLDKFVYRCFFRDRGSLYSNNFLLNALARRQKKQKIYDQYKEASSCISFRVDGEFLGLESRVALYLAYQLSLSHQLNSSDHVSIREFTRRFESLSSSVRKSVLNGAIDQFIECEALEHYACADLLSDRDREAIVADSLRSEYRLFSSLQTGERSRLVGNSIQLEAANPNRM